MLAISNMDAQVTLYMADGTPYPLPVVHLSASGVASVSVNDALAAAPPSLTSHISTWGSASVSYNYDWQGAILATMSLLDLSRSLQYVYPFVFPHGPSGGAMSGAMALEGLWWKTTATPHMFVALTNTAAEARDTTVTLLDASGARLSTQAVSIPPRGASMALVEFPAEGALGGLRVQYSGGMDDVLVGAGIEDGIAGYSANVPIAMTGMPDADGPRQFQFASPGIMNGPADPMMGFPKGLAFKPYIYLRNVASAPRAVQASVNWMNGSSAQTTSLPGIVLQPGESRQLSPSPFPGAEPEAFNFVFSFEGSVQDVLAATGGVDATGNYVFPVEPHGVGRHGGMTSVYWSYGGGFDTMYSVWNPLSIAQQAQLLLVGPDGRLIYAVPIRLAAQASAMIDLYELFASGKPDDAGRTLPPGPMHGTAVLTGPKNDTTERMTIVLAGATYNARTATCGSNCETCNGFTSVSATPSPESVAVSGSSQMQDEYTWYTGYQYNYTTSSTWSTNYPSIASIQVHTALLSGVSGGSFEVSANFGDLPTNAGQICTEGSLPSCPTGAPVAQVLGCVAPAANDPGSVSSFTYNITNVSAPNGPGSWGNTQPYNGTFDFTPYLSGGIWKARLTTAQGSATWWARLVPGVQEASVPVATASNYCQMTKDLSALGDDAGVEWYMVEAVQAHENVHVQEYENSFNNVFGSLKSAVESVTTAFQCGDTAASAKQRMQSAVSSAFSQANSEAISAFEKYADVNAQTVAAEHSVVDPVVLAIDSKAASSKWSTCP